MSTNVERFKYNAGASGTVTVPEGCCVAGLAVHATGAGATFTIAAQGVDTDQSPAGDAVPVPAGSALAFGAPVIEVNLQLLGPGTQFVFTGTDSYFIVYRLLRA